MENYMMIDGHKIPVPEEMIENIRKTFAKEDDLLRLESIDGMHLFNNAAHDAIQIGDGAVSEDMRGRCLVVDKTLEPEILPNVAYDCYGYPKIIVFHKK